MRCERDEVAARVFATLRADMPHDDRETRAHVAFADADAFMAELRQHQAPEWVCVGRRSGPVNGTTIQLSEAALARWFSPGRRVRAGVDPLAAARGGWQMRSGEMDVVSADEEHGTIEVDNAHRIVAFADGDYLFIEAR